MYGLVHFVPISLFVTLCHIDIVSQERTTTLEAHLTEARRRMVNLELLKKVGAAI